MVEGVRLSQDEIVDRFGVSRRVAVRVRALLARGMGVSGTVLEMERPGTPTEGLLLMPELLDGAEGLTSEAFTRIAGAGPTDGEELALVANDDGSRVIALAEEVDAGQAQVARRSDAAPMLLSSVATGLTVIGEEEARKLFTPEEVSRLKMIILTSADPAAKIEAVRRLALSTLNAADKGIVLIHALADADAAVRVEAAEALAALGLTPGIASAARSLGEGNLNQRIRAAERMGALAEKVSESEIGVVLTMLAGAINNEESTEVKTVLIRSFRGACGVVARSRGYVGEVLRLLVRQLEGAPELLYRPVREILGEIGRLAPGAMTDLIVEEMSNITARELRWLLYGVLAMFDVPEGRRTDLARLGVADLAGSDTPEEDCKGIGGMLCGWGPVAVQPLLEALPMAEDAQKMYMARLLDEIVCRRGGEDAAERAGEAMLDLLRVSSKHVRLPVLEMGLITHETLSDGLKTRIASELLANTGDFANPRVGDVIEAAAARLGEAALVAAERVLREEEDDARREVACRVLCAIVERHEDAVRKAKLAREMLDLCLQVWYDSNKDAAYLAQAIGLMCALSALSAPELCHIVAELRTVAFETADPVGVLRGLGHVGASRNLDVALRFDIAETFFRLLDTSLPEVTETTLASATNDEDEVHYFGGGVAAYTEMIPACLAGLTEMHVVGITATLKTKIRRFLLDKWRETASWRTIWPPEALEMLLGSLSRIAREAATDSECAVEIIEALSGYLDSVGVVRELGKMFLLHRSSAGVGVAACEVGEELLRRAKSLSGEEIGVALTTVSVIAARTGLGKDPAKARGLRERAVRVLYAGVKADLPEAVAGLDNLKDCPALPAATRDEIRLRLEIISGSEEGV